MERLFGFAPGTFSRTREAFFWEAWFEKQWPELFGDGLPGVLVMESATGRGLPVAVLRYSKLPEDAPRLGRRAFACAACAAYVTGVSSG